jgi:nicotinamidase-related amidase
MPITTLDPRTALVVIDLQQGMTSLTLLHPLGEIVARACALIEAFRRHALPVVLVNVEGKPPGRSERGFRMQVLPADFAELLPALNRQPQDHIVTKRTPGAFTNTDLEAYLKRQGITQIVLVGIATSSGVEATARHAYELGFNVSFAIDAITDGDAEAHANSLSRIFPKLGETDSSAAFITLLDNKE